MKYELQFHYFHNKSERVCLAIVAVESNAIVKIIDKGIPLGDVELAKAVVRDLNKLTPR